MNGPIQARGNVDARVHPMQARRSFSVASRHGRWYPNRSSADTAARSGFTLIELLVVIAIIGLLISLLAPSLQQAQGRARGVMCLSQMREIGTALYLFAGDHDGSLPYQHFYIGRNVTPYTLTPYLGFGSGPVPRQPTVFTCPSLQSRWPAYHDAFRTGAVNIYGFRWTRGGGNSHAANNMVDVPNHLRPRFLVEIQRPSQMMFYGDQPNFTPAHYYSAAISWMEGTIYAAYPERFVHAGRLSYVFMDGHAEQRSLQDLLDVMGGAGSFEPFWGRQ